MKNLLALAVLLLTTMSAYADVALNGLFADHMVLQRDMPVSVYGMAEPGEKVSVALAGQDKSATADKDGRWIVNLDAMKASTNPVAMTVAGKNKLAINDIVVGDVWVCSGQSNMEFTLGGCNTPQDIAAADFPTLRQIKAEGRPAGRPGNEVPGRWEVCTPASAPGFTAVGFYFARRIQKETGLPIGLIYANWGGTRIEPWTPLFAFEMEPPLANVVTEIKKREDEYRNDIGKSLIAVERWVADARSALATPGGEIPSTPQIPNSPFTDPNFPTALYNGRIHPFVPYAIKGALWYQGESNGGEGEEYYHKMRALIGGWRKVWNQGDFPFYFVQLANFDQPNQDPAGGNGWARVRMAQSKSLQIPNTGMAVIIDVGEANDIHPKNKFDVGERLARWALHNDYGKKDMVVSGPLFKSMKVEDGKIRIFFDSAGSGLMIGKKEGRNPTAEDKGGKLNRFSIAGEDKKWVWANAVIDGATVVVSSPDVPKPVAVRYAFSMNPEGCNLYNNEGLPASPFRTDEW
jgi:sialate O-acetylesterase